MHRIDLNTVCETYVEITKLPDFYEMGRFNAFLRIRVSRDAIRKMLDVPAFALRISKQKGVVLLRQIDEHIVLDHKAISDSERNFEEDDLTEEEENSKSRLYALAKEFINVLSVEFQDIHAYAIPDLGLYSVNALFEADKNAFDSDTINKLTVELLGEVRNAGRSLAFDLHTACGFHILRAAERAILRYMQFTGHPVSVTDKNRNWGVYMRVLKAEISANQRIVDHIEEVRVRHRNPLMHPELVLSANEAKALFGVCVTLIQSIADALPNQPVAL